MKAKHIVHLTSAHPRNDIRIFVKMSNSASERYRVSLIVADGNGDEHGDERVEVFDVGYFPGRINRMRNASRAVFNKALTLNADLYHLHDPELMPYALKLEKLGFKVIFDCHEDLPKQILSKPYLPKVCRKLLSTLFKYYESFVFKRVSGLIGATDSITDKLKLINLNSITVNNYPIIGELHKSIDDFKYKKNEICFLGGFSEIRGVTQLIDSLQFTKDVKLNLVGGTSEVGLLSRIEASQGWDYVNYHGIVDRITASEILSFSKAGIVTFLPVPNHIDAQPNKMFEYMSAGIPVIGSHFPLWKDILEGNECGICVDPESPHEIANAVNLIMSNPEYAEKMGKNGLKAIEDKYNWSVESSKLMVFYKSILND